MKGKIVSSVDGKYDDLFDDFLDQKSQCEELNIAAKRLGQLLHRFSVIEEERRQIDPRITDSQKPSHHDSTDKPNYVEEIILAKIIRQMANELVESKQSQLLGQQDFQERISTSVVKEFYGVWGKYAILCEEIDWIVLAECTLFLSEIKRFLINPQEKGNQEIKRITDTFKIAKKSATAYAISQIASNNDIRVSNLFRDLLGEWVMLETEVSMLAEKISITGRRNQQYYSQMERVFYDERAEQNSLDYQMITLSQQQKFTQEDFAIKFEDKEYQFITPQKPTQIYENCEESSSETSMEETSQGEQSTKKKLKILLKSKSISKNNILQQTSKLQSALRKTEQDNQSDLVKQLSIIQQQQQQKTVSWEQCNSELQEGNNSYPSDSQQLQLSTISQSTSQSKNASPQGWHFDSKQQVIPDSFNHNTQFNQQQEEKDSNPSSYNKKEENGQHKHQSIVDEIFEQDEILQQKSQKILTEEEPLKSWEDVYQYEDDYSNDGNQSSQIDKNLETIQEVQEEQQENDIQNQQQNQLEQNDQQNKEVLLEKPKIDLSLEKEPCIFNSLSPIKISQQEQQSTSEQEAIVQEQDQSNQGDLFPNGQDNMKLKCSSLIEEDNLKKQISSFKSPDGKNCSDEKNQQMSQESIKKHNSDNERNMQQQGEQEMNGIQDANNSDQVAQAGSSTCMKTTSQLDSKEDQEKHCEIPQTFYTKNFSKGFGDAEYDLMIRFQMEQDIESIRAEEGEFSDREISLQREAREKMFQQNKLALKLEQMKDLQKRRLRKLSEKVTHKTKLQRNYGTRSIRGEQLQETLKSSQIADRINIRRSGFQKPTNSAYQFDSDLEKSPVKESTEIDNSFVKKLTVIELEDEITLLLLTSSGVVYLLRDCNNLKEIQQLNQALKADQTINDSKNKTAIESWKKKSERLNVDGVVDELIFSTKLSKLLCKCQDGSLKIYQLNISTQQQSTYSNIFLFGNSKSKESTKNRPSPKQKAQATLMCSLDSSVMQMCLIEDHSAVAVYGKDLELKYCHLGSGCLQEFQTAFGDPNLPRIIEKQQNLEDSTEKQLLIPFLSYNPELNLLLVSESNTVVVLFDVSQQQQEQQQLLLLDRKQQFSITLQLKIKYKIECGQIGNIKCLAFQNTEIKNTESNISSKISQSLVDQNQITNPKILIGSDSSVLTLWDLNTSSKLNSTDLKSIPLEIISSTKVIIRNEFNVLVLAQDDLGQITEKYISEENESETITGMDLIRSLNVIAVATKQGQIGLMKI